MKIGYIIFILILVMCITIFAGTDPALKIMSRARQLSDFQKKYDDAINKFQELIKNYPASKLCAGAQYQIGVCYIMKGEKNTAKNEFDKVTVKYPDSIYFDDALFQIGFIEFQLKQYNKAIVKFKEIETKCEPLSETEKFKKDKVPAALYKIAECYEKQKDYANAKIYYLKLMSKYSKHEYGLKAIKRFEWIVKNK